MKRFFVKHHALIIVPAWAIGMVYLATVVQQMWGLS